MGMSRAATRKVITCRRGIKALKLREEGQTYAEIAKSLGITECGAWKIVTREFDRLCERRMEKAAAVVKLELARLDVMHKALWKKAKAGDQKAMQMVLKTMERRAALLGLDIQRTEVKVEESYALNVSAKIEEYVRELDRDLAARPKAVRRRAQGNGRGQSLDQAGTDVQAIALPRV